MMLVFLEILPFYNEVAGNCDYFFPGNSHLVADSAYPL